ncbi:MAG: 2OG-Fe(II) oxygenase [Candidatus Kapabacteria bacterium]|nr:2OG-Fe(II) oxygenase [Candidatus Kapabacteria bacterium]
MSDSQSHITFAAFDIEMCAEALARHGWYSCCDFLESETVTALRNEIIDLSQHGTLKKAAIGSGADIHAEVRGDFIQWIDEVTSSRHVQSYLRRIGDLSSELNRMLYCGIRRFEAHYALYPQGTVYQRHFDNFKGGNDRLFSCILYLNDDWTGSDGGALRLYHDGIHTDVLPHGGVFAIFRSDTMEHEVLPARRSRMSITGWMRRDM